MSKGTFPITESEAGLLHDLGWDSGYGWSSEFDWWRTNGLCADADTEVTQLELIRHLGIIRLFRRCADDAAKDYFKPIDLSCLEFAMEGGDND